MSDQDVFNGTTNETPSQEAPKANEIPATPNPPTDLLASITDETGRQKYNSVEDALKALQHSQQYISTLENEGKQTRERLAQLEEVVTRVTTVEDSVKELLTRRETPPETPAVVVDENKVADLVRQTLTAEQKAARRLANKQTVSSKLIERFGDKANEAVIQKAAEMNVPAERLGELAEDSPELVLKLFEVSAPTSANGPTHSVNLPPKPVEDQLRPPEKSLLSGATSEEQAAYMAQIKERVYKKYGVEQ